MTDKSDLPKSLVTPSLSQYEYRMYFSIFSTLKYNLVFMERTLRNSRIWRQYMRYRLLFARGMVRPLVPKVFIRLGKSQIQTEWSCHWQEQTP